MPFRLIAAACCPHYPVYKSRTSFHPSYYLSSHINRGDLSCSDNFLVPSPILISIRAADAKVQAMKAFSVDKSVFQHTDCFSLGDTALPRKAQADTTSAERSTSSDPGSS